MGKKEKNGQKRSKIGEKRSHHSRSRNIGTGEEELRTMIKFSDQITRNDQAYNTTS